MQRCYDYQVTSVYAGGDALRLVRPDGTHLPKMQGRSLAAVFRDTDHELLFIHHDILFEEQLDICLIEDNQLVDRLSLGRMFQPGELAYLVQTSSRQFGFDFPEGTSWVLDVHEKSRWAMPDMRLGTSRLHRFRTWFSLERDKR